MNSDLHRLIVMLCEEGAEWLTAVYADDYKDVGGPCTVSTTRAIKRVRGEFPREFVAFAGLVHTHAPDGRRFHPSELLAW